MKSRETLVLETENDLYHVMVEADYSIDKNYGADADGNRGVRRLELNDFEIVSISGKTERELVKRLPKATMKKLESWAGEQL